MLLSTHPSRSGTQVREIIWVHFVGLLVAEDIELTGIFLWRLLQMNSLIKVVVDHLTKINKTALVDLDFAFGIELKS